MSKGRQGEIKIKQTEQLGLTAEGNEEEMKSRENSDNLPQNKVSHKIKAAARHSQARTGRSQPVSKTHSIFTPSPHTTSRQHRIPL